MFSYSFPPSSPIPGRLTRQVLRTSLNLFCGLGLLLCAGAMISSNTSQAAPLPQPPAEINTPANDPPVGESSTAQPVARIDFNPPVNVVIRRTTGGILQGRLRYFGTEGLQFENPLAQPIDVPIDAIKTVRLPDLGLIFTAKDDKVAETIAKWATKFPDGSATITGGSSAGLSSPDMAHSVPARPEPVSPLPVDPGTPAELPATPASHAAGAVAMASVSPGPVAATTPASPPLSNPGTYTPPQPASVGVVNSAPLATVSSAPVSSTPVTAWYSSATPAAATTPSGSMGFGGYLVIALAMGLIGFVILKTRQS